MANPKIRTRADLQKEIDFLKHVLAVRENSLQGIVAALNNSLPASETNLHEIFRSICIAQAAAAEGLREINEFHFHFWHLNNESPEKI